MPVIDFREITRETLDQLARVGRAAVVPSTCGSKAAEVLIDAAAVLNDGDEQTHEKNDPKHGIALPAVPEQFFDQDKWKELISRRGGREKALHRISNPDPGALVAIRRQVGEQQSADGERAREEERIYRVGQSLVEEFRAQLISGKCVATGLQPPSIERATIPPELHRDLIYSFEHGVAKGGGYIFRHVQIVKNPGIEHQKSDVSASMVSWLVDRRAQQGEELKKTLLDSAHREFGDQCTTRAFDAAYRRVYGRKRGRPRKAGAE
jgi:hypothetical protein